MSTTKTSVPSSLLRYPKLFGYFVRFSISKAMEFRLDFWFRIVMDLLYYGVNIAFYEILYLHFPKVGGWSREQAMIFVAGYLFVDAVQMTLFSNNLWWLPLFVNRGDLDYYLLRPVSSLFFLSLRDFAANSFVNLLMTLGILVWAFHNYSVELGVWNRLFYVLLLLNGVGLFYMIQLLFIIPVFWTQSVEGFREVNWTLSKVQERPDRILVGWPRKFFTLVLPYCLITSFPARLVVEAFSWSTFLHIVAVTLAFASLILLLWRTALRSYSSASS